MGGAAAWKSLRHNQEIRTADYSKVLADTHPTRSWASFRAPSLRARKSPFGASCRAGGVRTRQA